MDRGLKGNCVKEQVIGGCMYVCAFLPYFVSVHAWKLAVLCICVALNNEDVMRGAQWGCLCHCVHVFVCLLCVSRSRRYSSAQLISYHIVVFPV